MANRKNDSFDIDPGKAEVGNRNHLLERLEEDFCRGSSDLKRIAKFILIPRFGCGAIS